MPIVGSDGSVQIMQTAIEWDNETSGKR
jgi:hypothetical protein